MVGIAAIFKNEAPYIIEWLAHHRLMGIERFFIADNDSTDATGHILRQLAAAGIISWRPWPAVSGNNPQISAYRALLAEFGNQVEWMAFLDADEYIWSQSDTHLLDFLDGIPPDVGALALNWATYGSSDSFLYTNAPTPTRFTWHANLSTPVNRNFKSIARPRLVRDFTCPHNVILDPSSRYIHTDGKTKRSAPSDGHMGGKYAHCQSESICWEHFRVNHYIIRSWEEYATKKSRRGRAYSQSGLDDLYFWGHDFHDDESPPSNTYVRALAREISVLEELIDKEVLDASRSTFGSTDIPPAPILGHIDSIERVADTVTANGWALHWTRYKMTACTISINNIKPATITVNRIDYPSVQDHHKNAELGCGFAITFEFNRAHPIESIKIHSTGINNEPFKDLTWSIDPENK